MSANRHLKVAQINLARSMAASDDLYKFCITHYVDVALVQEPYTRRGKLVNLEYDGVRIAKSKINEQHGIWAAIVVFNHDLDLIHKPNLFTEHTVVASLSFPGQSPIDAISSYFQFRKETAHFINEITTIDYDISRRTIMGMDVNAFSPWWHDTRRNSKGRLVEQMILDLGLTISNRQSDCWSFHGARGHSNVDVTLTRELHGKIRGWIMDDYTVCSDHSLITFTIADTVELLPSTIKWRFNDRKIDRARLQTLISCKLEYHHSNGSLNEDAKAITEAICEACKIVLPRAQRKKTTKPPWWSNEIAVSRQVVARAKRRMLTTKTPEDRAAFQIARNTHVSRIRLAKKNVWKSFVQDSPTSKNKWGRLTKWLIHGEKATSIPSVLEKPDGSFTSGITDTIDRSPS